MGGGNGDHSPDYNDDGNDCDDDDDDDGMMMIIMMHGGDGDYSEGSCNDEKEMYDQNANNDDSSYMLLKSDVRRHTP